MNILTIFLKILCSIESLFRGKKYIKIVKIYESIVYLLLKEEL